MQQGRPRLFETDTAWKIYNDLPPEQRTYANVARVITQQINLDPPLTSQAVSNRFRRAGLVEKKPLGAPKLKEKTLSGCARSRLKRQRDKVFDDIAEQIIVVKNEELTIKPQGVGRPRVLETDLAVEAYKKFGSIEKAANAIGFSYGAVRAKLQETGIVKRKMYAYLSREMASAILLDEQGDRWQYYRKICVCDQADILLKSGAKLKHDEKNGFYVTGYYTDGSDVKPYIKEYGAVLHPCYLTNI